MDSGDFDYDEDTDTYRTSVSFDDAPSLTVVEAIGVISDETVADIDPLYSSVDPDALDTIFSTIASGEMSGPVCVELTHAGHEVFISSDGRLSVRPVDESEN